MPVYDLCNHMALKSFLYIHLQKALSFLMNVMQHAQDVSAIDFCVCDSAFRLVLPASVMPLRTLLCAFHYRWKPILKECFFFFYAAAVLVQILPYYALEIHDPPEPEYACESAFQYF